MLVDQWRPVALFALLPVVTACSSSLKTPVVTPAAVAVAHATGDQASAPAPVAPVAPMEDPVVTLIASSDRYFRAGQDELEQGHVEAAQQEFNRTCGSSSVPSRK